MVAAKSRPSWLAGCLLYVAMAAGAFGQVPVDPSAANASTAAGPKGLASARSTLSREVSDEELSHMRAGFFTASGAQFDFGANILTQINGELALQTNLLWTAGGPVVKQLAGIGAPIEPTTLSNNAAAPGSVAFSGVQISNPSGGSTQLFANVNAGQIQNVLVNSASGQAITQNTNINLTIYNFQAWQAQLAQGALSSQLNTQLLNAAGIGGH
jgi:hypothetical protein